MRGARGKGPPARPPSRGDPQPPAAPHLLAPRIGRLRGAQVVPAGPDLAAADPAAATRGHDGIRPLLRPLLSPPLLRPRRARAGPGPRRPPRAAALLRRGPAALASLRCHRHRHHRDAPGPARPGLLRRSRPPRAARPGAGTPRPAPPRRAKPRARSPGSFSLTGGSARAPGRAPPRTFLCAPARALRLALSLSLSRSPGAGRPRAARPPARGRAAAPLPPSGRPTTQSPPGRGCVTAPRGLRHRSGTARQPSRAWARPARGKRAGPGTGRDAAAAPSPRGQGRLREKRPRGAAGTREGKRE